jgi:gliding motility-associated-like protein
MYGSSGFDYMTLPIPHSNLSAINYDTVHRCLGDTLALLVEHNPDSVPVEWIVDGVSHFGDAHSFLLTELTTHAVQCVLHYECPDTTTTFVAVVPPPLITVAHDTTVCRGATLSVEQPDAISYLWSNGATTPSVSVDSASTFQVSVTNIGCRAESDSFHVSLYGQSAVDFGNDSTLCELATLLLDATQPHPAEYLWQDNSTNTSYLVYRDGEYWVVVTDRCLGASDTVHIGYLSDFAVSLGPDTTLCEGRTLVLSPGVEHCDYLWQDGSAQPVYVVRGPGTYSVEVSNRCFTHWDAVDIDYESCAQELYLPNAFTPDGNGLNEVFLPVFSYPDEVEEYRMEIYNRWGTMVFRSEEKTFGWDARNAPSGVYAVKIYYKTRGDVSRTVTGNVTVVR